MRTYQVVCLTDQFQEIVNYYPSIVSSLYIPQSDLYGSKQVENLFLPIQKYKKRFLEIIQERDDYSYYHGQHILHNSITDENIKIFIHEYDIEVVENEGKHIIFNILREISKNFYMIEI